MLPGAVVKFGRHGLLFAFVDFVVSAESLVMLKYQVNVGKSINAYRSASDTCASVIKSTLSIWSLGLL